MNHHTSPQFWTCYQDFPVRIQKLADLNFELLKLNPMHPSLHFKKAGRFWTVRIGISWRAIAVEQETDLIWFWIGSHADHDKMLRQA